MASGQLTKLRIFSYETCDMSAQPTEENTFTTLINPNEYSMTFKQDYTNVKPITPRSENNKTAPSEPDVLQFKFWFDTTGAFPQSIMNKNNKDLGVELEMKRLKKLLFKENRQPKFLRILWGTLDFACQVVLLKSNYLLFNPNGVPLRASVDISFREFLGAKLAEIKNDSLKDEMKERTVRDGDTLLSLCLAVYGSSMYYMAVAKENKLPNFRKLGAGTKVRFPPIK